MPDEGNGVGVKPDPRAVMLATDALHAAQREDWDAAKTAVEALDALGGGALTVAICGWCDTLILAQQQHGWAQVARPVWYLPDGTLITDASQVAPETRWAGQVLTARGAMDLDMLNALFGALPADPGEAGDHVITLLTGVAETLNLLASAPAGGAA